MIIVWKSIKVVWKMCEKQHAIEYCEAEKKGKTNDNVLICLQICNG